MDRQNQGVGIQSLRFLSSVTVPFYADLHVHSKYSRATSRDADLEHLALWARRKGITVVGTGDFTHPAWFEEIRAKLATLGNIASDGRPILGLDSRHLLEIALGAGPDAYLIPAHIWAPWFAALGSKSGFDSIDECYGDLAPHIFAVETGLSSDPPMNWRVSQLDRFTLVSNSDAHSPPKLGREACAFDTDLDYFAIRRALETGEGYGGTVEFFPEEGKYHLDGHRACGVRLEPPETRRLEGRCPSCGKPLTVGVMHRVEELADRPEDAAPPRPVPFRSLVQLREILAEIPGVGANARSVDASAAPLL